MQQRAVGAEFAAGLAFRAQSAATGRTSGSNRRTLQRGQTEPGKKLDSQDDRLWETLFEQRGWLLSEARSSAGGVAAGGRLNAGEVRVAENPNPWRAALSSTRSVGRKREG